LRAARAELEQRPPGGLATQPACTVGQLQKNGVAGKAFDHYTLEFSDSNHQEQEKMKKDIHPKYHPVVFVDPSVGAEFVTRSTMTSGEVRNIDGVDHYVIRMEISSASHPFFTGKQRFVDTAGRVERFREKYNYKDAE
jgi:large subunit ribosomal protein L31